MIINLIKIKFALRLLAATILDRQGRKTFVLEADSYPRCAFLYLALFSFINESKWQVRSEVVVRLFGIPNDKYWLK